ncbi:MAG: hypothetical protein QOK44_1180 [Betaproteobacteria bacterium]|nr:hypothetical protein [Betaproteobacteria bacterium]
MRSRRSSATLTLVLIGAAALQGCGGKQETATRDVYRSRTDCQRDWGDDEKKCETVSSGPHAGYFYGPSYGYGYGGTGSSPGNTLAPRPGSNAAASTQVTRGGFGSSASAHSSGG